MTASFPVLAGMLIRDYEGQVLLFSAGSGDWDLPGGLAEGTETPAEACSRAVGQGIGVLRRPGRLLLVDAVPGVLVFVFDGGRLDSAEETRTDGEVRFVGVGELESFVSPSVAQRIATVVSETGDPYAQDGRNLPDAGWGYPRAETS